MSSFSGFTLDQIQATIELVQVYDLSRRAAIAALSWMLYDYFLTFPTEITHVWLRPWSVSKILYGWTRYVGMTIATVFCVSGVLTVSQTSPAISCNLFYYFGAWGGVITQTTLSVIMILRLWALYEGSRRLAIVWGVLISIHITALCLIFGLGEEIPPFDTPIPYYTLDLNICFAPDSPPYFTGIWVSRLALDTILFFFVLWKAFEQYLKGWHSDIVELLITDNVVAFALVCLIQVGNLVIFLVATPQGAQGGVGFAIATDVIIGCRLLLHTKEVVYKRRDPYETEFGLEPASAFQANVTPKGRQSFAAALRDSYGGSTVSSDNLSRQFREIGGITLAPIGQVPAPDASRATRESQSSGSV